MKSNQNYLNACDFLFSCDTFWIMIQISVVLQRQKPVPNHANVNLIRITLSCCQVLNYCSLVASLFPRRPLFYSGFNQNVIKLGATGGEHRSHDLLYPTDRSFPLCYCQVVIYCPLVYSFMKLNRKKASAIKNAILVIAFLTPQHLRNLGWIFVNKFFSALYLPQDSEVRKIMGCLKCNYENCIFNSWCLKTGCMAPTAEAIRDPSPLHRPWVFLWVLKDPLLY